MSNATTLTKGQKTRLSLIKAAQSLFARKGYKETGVDDIVASIGLSIGVFYSNFKSKEDLLKTVLSEQIVFSKKYILELKPNESLAEWVQRAIYSYLSPQHRDAIEISCPLTTMSQELYKLELEKKSGLLHYIHDFEEALKNRLNEIQKGLGDLAPAVISICIGGLQAARLQKNSGDSDRYLEQSRKAAMQLIFGKNFSTPGGQ